MVVPGLSLWSGCCLSDLGGSARWFGVICVGHSNSTTVVANESARVVAPNHHSPVRQALLSSPPAFTDEEMRHRLNSYKAGMPAAEPDLVAMPCWYSSCSLEADGEMTAWVLCLTVGLSCCVLLFSLLAVTGGAATAVR